MFKSSLYFSGFKPTRKESEVIYLLVTNTNILNKAQNKADNLLQNVCGKRQATINKNLLERKKRPLIHNQVSSYAAVLSQKTSQNSPKSMIYYNPSYKRPVFISFTPESTNINKP